MASWFAGRETGGDKRIRLPPVQQKSKIPVRMTQLSSDSDKSLSSEDETEKKRHLPRDSVNKLGNKPPSRIPLAVGEKKSSADKKKLNKNIKPAKDEKPLGKDSGINLCEERRKQSAVRMSPNPPTAAKGRHYGASEGANKHGKPRTPRQLTPLENKKTSKNTEIPRGVKEPRDDTSASDTSSPERTDDVTPDFECNVIREDVTDAAETKMSDSDLDDDFERHSTSSDERDMPNVPPWLRDAVKQKRQQEQTDEKKEPRDDNSASDNVSPERTDDVTPDFECNVAREAADLILSAVTTMSGIDYDDDFERFSTSSDEREMPNVPHWLRQDVKEKREQKEADQRNETHSDAEAEVSTTILLDPTPQDICTETHPGAVVESMTILPGPIPEHIYIETHPDDKADVPEVTVVESMTILPDQTPQDICTDFVADELSKIIEQLSVMNADMTEEEHADAMSSLLLLRDEAREREEAIVDENNDIAENKNNIKDDVILATSANQIDQPNHEADTKEEANSIGDEEFDCSSMSLDSEGKRKMAELDEKSILLKAHFAEENRVAVESLENIKKEMRASQEKEATITQEVEEFRTRFDDLKENMTRLEKISRRREREEMKWRKKMDKKMKKNASRLEKVRAERLQYQKEKEAENGQPDEQSSALQELKSPKAEVYDAPNETTITSKEVLYDPTEVTDYSSVEELEKKRKELRRLEKLEKKATKKGKLERKERKKIEKQKRKIERKLAKMKAEKSTVSENDEASKCENVELSDICESVAQEKSATCTDGIEKDQPDAALLDVKDVNSEALNKDSEQVPSEESSSHHEEEHEDKQTFQSCAVEDDGIVTGNTPSKEDEIIIEEIPDSLEPLVKTDTRDQRIMQLTDNAVASCDGLPVKAELDNDNFKEPTVSNHSDEQQIVSLDFPNINEENEGENYLNEITEDLVSIEEDIVIQPESGDEDNDGGSPGFNKPSPLIRKQSGRFSQRGLQPFVYSPENRNNNGIVEDMDSCVEDLGEYQPHERSSEENSWTDDSKVNITDLPKDVQEALLQKYIDSKDEHEAGKMDIIKVYQEVSRHSTDSNSFNLEEVSPQHSNQLVVSIGQETEDEIEDDVSINDQHFPPFVYRDDDNILQTKQQSLGEDEAPSQEERSCDTEVSVGCDDELRPFENATSEVIYEELDSVKEDDIARTENVDVSNVCENDLDCIEDVLKYEKEERSAGDDRNEQTEDVEVSTFNDGDLDYIEDVIWEDRVLSAKDEDSVETEDIEVSSVCKDNLDYLEVVICEKEESSAWEDKNMQTEDMEVSTVNDDDLDYVENVMLEEEVSSAGNDDSVDTEDSSVCEDDLDYIEDAVCEKEESSGRENEHMQTEDIEVSTINNDELHYIEDVICEEVVKSARENEDPDNSDSRKPSIPVAVCCKSVYSSTSVENQTTKEQYFIDEFDELLDQVEEEMEQEDSLSSNSPCGKEKFISEDVVCSLHDNKSPEKPLSPEDIPLDNVPASESNSHSLVSQIETKKSDDESSAYEDENSAQSISDVESLLSSSDQELPDMRDDVLFVISEEDEDDPDSWEAFDDIKLPCCRSGNCDSCLVSAVLPIEKRVDRANDLIEKDSSENSFTSVSELLSEELLVRDREVADNNGETSEDEDDDPDSWNVLDDLTFPGCRVGKCSSYFNDTVTDVQHEQTAWKHEGSVAAVVNISEHLLRKELSDAFKTATTVPNTSQSLDSSAEPKAFGIPLNKQESSERKNHFNKNLRQQEEEHTEISDEQKTPCVRTKSKLQILLEEEEEKNKALKEIVDFTNKENDKLLDEVIAMKEEAKTIKIEKEILNTELETLNLELKRLKANDEYKERELTNLRDDIHKKEQQLKDLQDDLDYAHMDKKDLLYDIDSLEDKLKESENGNEELQFQVDELKEMIKKVKMAADLGNNGHDYSYLREEVELLKGSLDFSTHREELLQCQLDGLKQDYNTFRNENERIVSSYKQLSDLKDENERIMKQLQDQLAALERENSILNEELHTEKLNASHSKEEFSEMKAEKKRIIEQLQDQIVSLKKENCMVTAERLKACDKDVRLNELEEEKARITADLEDQLAKLNEENCRVTAELSGLSDKYKQLSEIQQEKTKFTVQLQKRLAKLEKEKSRMAAELSKISDKDSKLNQLLKQVEDLRNQNKYLQNEALEAKNQLPDKTSSSSEGSWEDDHNFKNKNKKNKHEIRKLKKRVRQNECEIAHLGRFVGQRGLDTGDATIWLNSLKDERKELENIRNTLRLQTERFQQREDEKKEVEILKQCLQQKENELVQTQDGLRLMAETTEALKRCVAEMDNFLQYVDSNTCNSDISSIIDDCDRDSVNDPANLDLCSLEEDGHRPLTANSKEEAGDEELIINTMEDNGNHMPTVNSKKETEHKGLTISSEEKRGHKELIVNLPDEARIKEITVNSEEDDIHEELIVNLPDEARLKGMIVNSEEDDIHEELIVNLEDDTKPMTSQVAHLNEILTNSLEDVQYLKKALQHRQELWEQKSSVQDSEMEYLRHRVRTQEGEMDSLKSYVTQVEDDSVEFMGQLDDTIKELQGNLETTQNSLNEKEALLKQAEAMLTAVLASSEEKYDEFVKLQENIADSTQVSFKRKTDALEQQEAKPTSLLAESEEKHGDVIKPVQENFERTQISLKEKTEALEQAEVKLQIKASLLATAETKYDELMAKFDTSIKGLKRDLESTQISLKERTDALKQAEAKLHVKTSLLATAEVKHDELMAKFGTSIKGLQKELESMQISLKEKTDSLEKAEVQLQLKTSLLTTAEMKQDELVAKFENSIKGLQKDLESTQILLKEKTDALEHAEVQLQLKTSLLTTAEVKQDELVAKFDNSIKGLQKDLESTQILLKEKTDALEHAEVQLQLKTSLLTTTAVKQDELVAKFDNSIKGLQNDLESTQNLLKEKTDALEHAEVQLQLKTSLLATAEVKQDELMAKFGMSTKELQKELESTQILLKEKTDALDQAEAKLTFLANSETQHKEFVKQLQENLKSTQISLKKKTDALNETELKLQSQASRLASEEKKHEDIVRKMDNELKSRKIAIKETKAASQKTEAKLKLNISLLASAEAKLSLRDNELEELRSENKDNVLKLETLIRHLEEELENTKISLEEKSRALEKTEMDSKLKRLLHADTDRKREGIGKQLEGDLERMQNYLKEKEAALGKAELDLQSKSSLVLSLEAKVCLRGHELEELKLTHKCRDLELARVTASLKDLTKLMEIADILLADKNKEIFSLKASLTRKNQDVQKLKFDMEPTQDKLELVSAELGRAKNKKTILLREVTTAVARLEHEKIAGERERNVLQQKIKTAFEVSEAKTEQIRDLKVNLKESRIQVSELESDKQETEDRDGKNEERIADEIKWLKQALKASNENNVLFESRIALTKQENSELRREIQRLKAELLQKETEEMTRDAGDDVSSRPLMWAALDAKDQEMRNKIRTLRNELNNDVVVGRHSDVHTSQGPGTKRFAGHQSFARPGNYQLNNCERLDLTHIC